MSESFIIAAKLTPIALVQQIALRNPDSILFKLPTSESSHEIWKDITYSQFFADVERVACHTLCKRRWPEETVIGIWTSGISYPDVVHIFAIMRAGCVPHLINVDLSTTLNDVLLDLLNESNASALFVDRSLLGRNLSKFDIDETFLIRDIEEYPTEIDRELLPSITKEISPERLVLMLQTSGSTGGRCKLVRYDFRIYDALVKKRKHIFGVGRRNGSLTATRVGSFCHCAQIIGNRPSTGKKAMIVLTAFIEFIVVISFAGTMILLKPNFNSSKLLQMYRECGLTAFGQFSAFIALHLKNSRTDPDLLRVLKSMDEILFMGSPLPEDELEWALENKIPLVNGYGLTECGGLLVGWRGNPAHLVTLDIDGLQHEFRSFSHVNRDLEISLNPDIKNQNLKELVVLSKSIDCPHPSLRSKTDGHFHTGDVFVEVSNGGYMYKGRMDDLIKMENGRICDTKSIEDHIRRHCADLVHACVVVGTHRPFPTLLVEPKTIDAQNLPTSIELELATYNVNVYQHERVSRNHIIIVPKGSLPRTLKGNIRRKVAEQMFSKKLDQLYGPIHTS